MVHSSDGLFAQSRHLWLEARTTQPLQVSENFFHTEDMVHSMASVHPSCLAEAIVGSAPNISSKRWVCGGAFTAAVPSVEVGWSILAHGDQCVPTLLGWHLLP